MNRIKKSKQATGRACAQCGRALPEFTPSYVAERLRTLRDQIRPRPSSGKETAQQVRERSAAWDETIAIHARVQVVLLADEADGFCALCAPSIPRDSD